MQLLAIMVVQSHCWVDVTHVPPPKPAGHHRHDASVMHASGCSAPQLSYAFTSLEVTARVSRPRSRIIFIFFQAFFFLFKKNSFFFLLFA
jgi:hypothetical protein